MKIWLTAAAAARGGAPPAAARTQRGPGGFSAQLRELVDSLLRVDVAARASAADAYERAVAAAG